MFKLTVFVVLMFHSVNCIYFELVPNVQKCLREYISANALVLGEFEVNKIPGWTVYYQVADSKDNVLARKEDAVKGKFSFSTEIADTVEICFLTTTKDQYRFAGPKQFVRLVLRTGVEAKSYDDLLQAGKLKPIEVELKKLEDLTESIVGDFQTMRQNELKMSDTNESTNIRVFYLSLVSMLVLLCSSLGQVVYLRKYFRSRKLIE